MIPSLDAHKVCRLRNNRSHIKLKQFNKTFILFALLALLSMNAIVNAQDDTSDTTTNPESSTTSGGTTQSKTTSTSGSPY